MISANLYLSDNIQQSLHCLSLVNIKSKDEIYSKISDENLSIYQAMDILIQTHEEGFR